jgi:hypothetical protein
MCYRRYSLRSYDPAFVSQLGELVCTKTWLPGACALAGLGLTMSVDLNMTSFAFGHRDVEVCASKDVDIGNKAAMMGRKHS